MVRRRSLWAALVLVVLALLAPGVAAPDARAASMHPKIRQKLDALKADPDSQVTPGKLLWQIRTGGGYWARFEWADILYRSDIGQAYEVHGEIRRRWIALGGPGTVGFPVADERKGGRWERTRVSVFTNGELQFLGQSQTIWIKGAILRRWRSLPMETRAKLGMPLSDEEGVPGATVVTLFERGAISYARGRIDVTHGQSALEVYNGAVIHKLGVLLGPDRSTSIPGLRQTPFSDGGVWWRRKGQQAVPTRGAIHRRYLERIRAVGEPVGYGEDDSRCGREQRFANGVLVWSRSLGVSEISGDLYRQLVRRDRLASVGCPQEDARRRSDGSVRQEFLGAQVIWSPNNSKLLIRYRTSVTASPTGDEDYPVSIVVRTVSEMDGAPSANGRTTITRGGREVWSCDHADDGSWCHPILPPGSYRAEYSGSTTQFPASVSFVVR